VILWCRPRREEIEALMRAGVTVRSCPASRGAGLCGECRDPAHPSRSCAGLHLVTGHCATAPWHSTGRCWRGRVRPSSSTWARDSAIIAARLIEHGLPASTPIALIENGTTSRERRVVGTLATIEHQAMRARLRPDTLHGGEVIGLALARDPEFHFVSGIGL